MDTLTSRTLWLLSRGYVLRGGVDNVEADAGTGGATFATDDIGGVHYPRTKIALGAADAYDMDLDSGQQTMANSLPVAIASNQSALTVAQATAANLNVTEASAAAIKTAVETIDNAISGSEMQVDVVGALPAGNNNIGDVDVASVTGDVTVINAGTFATQVDGAALTALQLIDDVVYVDDTATHATGSSKGALIMAAAAPTDAAVNANDIGAVGMTVGRSMYVSVQDALPAGANAIGKLAANSGVDIGDVDITSIAAGDNNIGNVDVVTLPALPAGTNNIGDVDVASIAAGDNNIGNVDIVSVPAPLSTTGSGTEATALRVTVATDSTGVLSVDDNGGALTVDNGGTFAVQVDGAALTALQLIDDVVYTDDTSTHSTGTSKGVLVMGVADPTDAAVSANDIGALSMTTSREVRVATGLNYSAASAAQTQTNLDGLADSSTHVAGWESTAIDNSTTRYRDFIINAVLRTEGAAVTAGQCRMYLVAELDDSTWPDVFDGTESAETVVDTEQRDAICRLAASSAHDTGTAENIYLMCPSAAAVFNGTVPRKFVIFITQNTGTTLETTGDPNQVYVKGVY